jgi:hypothetical protein
LTKWTGPPENRYIPKWAVLAMRFSHMSRPKRS